MKAPRYSYLLAAMLLAACSSGDAPDTGAVADNGLPPGVNEALVSAARGEPFEDDVHPETARTGKPMTPIQAAFDVRHYRLSLRVMPDTRTIDGTLDVTFAALEELDAIELDLDPRLDIHGARLDGEALEVTRDEDSFIVALPVTMEAGARATVSVDYGGKPHIAKAPPWHGGFVWSEVDGTPWFATAVQGEGCDLWWPCKDTFADKPDEGVRVSVAAPKGVTVATVGVQ